MKRGQVATYLGQAESRQRTNVCKGQETGTTLTTSPVTREAPRAVTGGQSGGKDEEGGQGGPDHRRGLWFASGQRRSCWRVRNGRMVPLGGYFEGSPKLLPERREEPVARHGASRECSLTS